MTLHLNWRVNLLFQQVAHVLKKIAYVIKALEFKSSLNSNQPKGLNFRVPCRRRSAHIASDGRGN